MPLGFAFHCHSALHLPRLRTMHFDKSVAWVGFIDVSIRSLFGTRHCTATVYQHYSLVESELQGGDSHFTLDGKCQGFQGVII